MVMVVNVLRVLVSVKDVARNVSVRMVKSAVEHFWLPVSMVAIILIVCSIFYLFYTTVILRGYEFFKLNSGINHAVNVLINKESINRPKYGLAVGNVFTILQHILSKR